MKKRKIAVMFPSKLTYCDTGELVKLLSTLGNSECSKMHIKINEYFWRTLNAVSFIIERTAIPARLKVRAIGRVELQDPIEIQEDSLFVLKTMDTKQVQRVQRSELEGVLMCALGKVLIEEYKSASFCNCFLCPVEHPCQRKTIPYFVALINANEFFECEKIYYGIVTECMRHTFGMIKTASHYKEEKTHHEKVKSILTAFIQITSSIGTDMIYHEIQMQSMDALGASSCNVYASNTHQNLCLKSSNADDEKIDMKPLTSFVFENGISYSSNNPFVEPLYGACDEKDVPRNFLAFPVCVGEETLGVVEMYDKLPPQIGFNRHDVDMTKPLGQVIGLAIQTNNRYGSFLRNKFRMSFSDCIFLRRTKIFDDYHGVFSTLKCKHDHKYHRFGDVRFDTSSVPEDHVICVCLRIFEGLGLLSMFFINREKFVRFLLKVRQSYNILPFHSWPQAYATMHFTFVCINSLNLIKNRYITGIEALAMLLAALCHCIDSRGSTNMFQMTSGSVLASLFSSPGSLAQLHSASQAIRLMNFPECNFLECLPDEQFLAFATLLFHMIKDMDISHNQKNLKSLDTLVCNEFNFNDISHRRLIHKLILNCAQLNFVCKTWQFCRRTGENCFNEFFRKGDLSNASGVYEISDLNEDILKLPEMNTNFIEVICLPTFRIFVNIFPYMSSCMNKIQKNLMLWKVEKEKILASMVKDALGDTADDED